MNRGSHSIMKPVEGCHIRVLYTQTNKGLKELTEVVGRTETASLFQTAGACINLSFDLGLAFYLISVEHWITREFTKQARSYIF